jgi:hypothetical protein
VVPRQQFSLCGNSVDLFFHTDRASPSKNAKDREPEYGRAEGDSGILGEASGPSQRVR